VTGHSAQEWKLTKSSILTVAVPGEMSCIEGVRLTQEPQPSAIPGPTRPAWVSQLIGDSSETVALSRFRQMQGRLRSALGSYDPTVLRTSTKAGASPIWVRVRIEFDTRQAAESLCSKMEAAGAPCLVQRNFEEVANSRKSPTSETNRNGEKKKPH
jgi:hypothetical protein